jgi:asparagine synthase (glutamine-hydrolysing)
MCGILAYVGPNPDTRLLEEALGRLTHRGPDAHGTWTDGRAWLGHRRLKIIDLSDSAAQPMANEDGTVHVTFNGEIYNFPELRRLLEEKGHRFRSRSDTEVIVHGYEEWGDACVERFWGMFAFAVWDSRRRRLLAARDRFGKKPLSYLCRAGRFVLASEIPALLATGLSQRKVSLHDLGLFWGLNYLPAPATGLTDVRKLPAGHALSLENGNLRIWMYYPPERVQSFRGTDAQAREQVAALLTDAVRRRLVSDVPVGVTLSGGIDSTLVAATARKLVPGRLVTLTVRPHLDNNRHDEGHYARQTAQHLGTEHYEVRPEPVLLESLGRVIQNLGEPFAIASAIPTYYLYQALKERATVILSGDGGDENFGGYDHYRYLPWRAHALRFAPAWACLYRALSRVYGWVPATRPRLKTVLALLQVAQGRPPSEADWEAARVLRPGARRALWDREPDACGDTVRMLFSERDPRRLGMLCDQFTSMAYHILTKVDIASMAHAVEVRSPLLDHRLAELARGLPLRLLMNGSEGKLILKDLLRGQVPAEVLSKPKTGFGLPIREVFAGPGRAYLTEVLTAPHPAYDSLVDRRRLPEVIASHCQGRPYHTSLLLKLLVLRLWLESTQADLN